MAAHPQSQSVVAGQQQAQQQQQGMLDTFARMEQTDQKLFELLAQNLEKPDLPVLPDEENEEEFQEDVEGNDEENESSYQIMFS